MHAPELSNPDLLRQTNFIAGNWLAAAKGGSLSVRNPAYDREFWRVADSTAADAGAALDAAADAARSWRGQTARQRSALLQRWHRLVIENANDLGRIISAEQGKPMAEALGEVAYGASYIEWYAAEALRCNGEVLPRLVPGSRQWVLHEPVGVVAAITPWNFPLAMIARKIAPALAAGCTVVAKPAEDTPLTALALMRLLEQAGLPAGVANIITTSRLAAAETVRVWLDDFRVRKLAFTGSTATGKYLAGACSSTLKRLTLELGGNAPFIVFDDADLKAALDGLMKSKFRNAGQTCVSPNRFYVQAGVYAEFSRLVADRIGQLKVGEAHEPGVEIGPLINARAVEKIEAHIADALQGGARLLVGGARLRDRPDLGPQFFQPTVLADANHDMLLCHEETFGPVVALFPFTDEAEVLQRANSTPSGLAAYFYTRDVERTSRVAEALEAGVVGINQGALANEAAPFGGNKESGYGREGSRHGLDEYLQLKYLNQGELD